jgi:branched-subunit amino acid transport protein
MLWVVMIVSGVITYLFRASFMVAAERLTLPRTLQRALAFVPAAVLSAIILPALLLTDDRLNLSPANPRLIAGLLAALVAWYTRSVLLTIVVGMGVLVLLHMVV